MHPGDCPEWDYDTHPLRDKVLAGESAKILLELRYGSLNSLVLAADSRPIHYRLFKALVPPGYDYFAGHYRGEPFRCLQYYNVEIRSDPRVGCPCDRVLTEIGQVEQVIRSTLAVLDVANALPRAQLPPEQKVVYIVAFACRILELLFRVHPYADGNGHAGRFVVLSILGRYGYWSKGWTVHPRPPDPPYTELIARYRSGDIEPLEIYMLNAIADS